MNQSRSKKALNNTILGFSHEIVSLICSLILPRLILTTFGSAYNGITSSVTQFLSIIYLMQSGVGVVNVALYKPLEDRNYQEISEIIVETEHYMRKVALISVLFAGVLAVVYPIWINDEFSWPFSASLILILALSTFIGYYFGISYQILLNADQKQWIVSCAQIVSTVLNAILSVILINSGASIHMVKLGSTAAFAINPLILNYYARKHYHIDRTVRPKTDHLKQRWDAVWHDVAGFVNTNTDVMLLTVFSGVKEISVYSVYSNTLLAIRRVIQYFVTGFRSAFGNMYARGEYSLMHENLRIFEVIVFSIATIFHAVTLVMITPFALLYTSGVTDVNYSRPLFGILATFASLFMCLRIPYYTVTTAVGHYKQTRNGAFFEAVLNLVLSVVLVPKYGVVGVTIGTLAAAIFRSCQYANYLSKHVLKRSIFIFIGHLTVSIGIMGTVYFAGMLYISNPNTVVLWILKAVITTCIATVLTLITDLIFWNLDSRKLIKKFSGVFHSKKQNST